MTSVRRPGTVVPLALAAAEDALRRADWRSASDEFRAALAVSDSPEGREGLALACFWQGDAQSALEAQETAYRLVRALVALDAKDRPMTVGVSFSASVSKVCRRRTTMWRKDATLRSTTR